MANFVCWTHHSYGYFQHSEKQLGFYDSGTAPEIPDFADPLFSHCCKEKVGAKKRGLIVWMHAVAILLNI